jgi:hypothetical protein
MGLKNLLWAMVGALAATACGGAAAQFPFRYYPLDPGSHMGGKLEGDKPENDLPLETCDPRPGNEKPCIVMLSDEVKRLKVAYRDLVLENEDLRKNCPSQ